MLVIWGSIWGRGFRFHWFRQDARKPGSSPNEGVRSKGFGLSGHWSATCLLGNLVTERSPVGEQRLFGDANTDTPFLSSPFQFRPYGSSECVCLIHLSARAARAPRVRRARLSHCQPVRRSIFHVLVLW